MFECWQLRAAPLTRGMGEPPVTRNGDPCTPSMLCVLCCIAGSQSGPAQAGARAAARAGWWCRGGALCHSAVRQPQQDGVPVVEQPRVATARRVGLRSPVFTRAFQVRFPPAVAGRLLLSAPTAAIERAIACSAEAKHRPTRRACLISNTSPSAWVRGGGGAASRNTRAAVLGKVAAPVSEAEGMEGDGTRLPHRSREASRGADEKYKRRTQARGGRNQERNN